jgi:glycosyltransferase involved in cell wall biosynthesis
MENGRITVLLADDVEDWRGGQRQAALLLEGLRKRGLRPGAACAEPSALFDFCRSRSIPAFALPFRGEMDLVSAVRLARLVKRRGIRIVHAQSAHALGICLIAKGIVPGTVLVATRHVAFSVRKSLWGPIKYNIRLLDAIVCVSGAVRRSLLNDGVDPKKLHVIHGGIDVNRFAQSVRAPRSVRRPAIPRGAWVVGTVAAFTAEKDYSTLFEAARIVLEKNSKVLFYAVGDGPDRARIARLVNESGLTHRFLLAETGSRSEDHMGIFDAFVLASRNEGLGLSILEAQCLGLPVVATAVGGIPEIVTDGRNGLLVPPGAPRALAAAILRLAGNARLRGELGERGARSARLFTDERMVDRTVSLYRTLLDGRTPGKSAPRR